MKIISFSAFALLAGLEAIDAFVPSRTLVRSTHQHLMSKQPDNNNPNEKSVVSSQWWGPAAAFVAGLTLAGQVSIAAPPPTTAAAVEPIIETTIMARQPTTLLSAFGGFSGSSYETMDFSMPSYEEGTKASAPKVNTAPTFNPFGDLKEESSDDKSSSAAEKVIVSTLVEWQELKMKDTSTNLESC